jgi:uncharacterized protein DUF6152
MYMQSIHVVSRFRVRKMPNKRAPSSGYATRLLRSLTVAAALAATGMPAFAHHAFSAEYDGQKYVEFTGYITKFELVNPHSWLYVEGKKSDGSEFKWAFEFGSPVALREKGLSAKKVFTRGTPITIRAFPAKSGKNYGYAYSVTLLKDGTTYSTGGGGDVPKPPDAGSGTRSEP